MKIAVRNEFKPCPFCGEKNIVVWKINSTVNPWRAKCIDGCSFTMRKVSRDALLKHWNMRPVGKAASNLLLETSQQLVDAIQLNYPDLSELDCIRPHIHDLETVVAFLTETAVTMPTAV